MLRVALLLTFFLPLAACADEPSEHLAVAPSASWDLSDPSVPLGCESLTCPEGTRCTLDEDRDGAPVPVCVEIEPASCFNHACGEAASCHMQQVCSPTGLCVEVPACVPLACEEQPPPGGCEASCGTGYVREGESTTCSCCSPADEAAPRLCLHDDECGPYEACSHAGGCASGCSPDDESCSQVCWGRCTHPDLFLSPLP